MIDEKILSLSKHTILQINESFDNKILSVIEKFKSIVSIFYNFLKLASKVDVANNTSDNEFSLQFTSNVARIQFLISKYKLPSEFANLIVNINKLKHIHQNDIDENLLVKLKDSVFYFLNYFAEPKQFSDSNFQPLVTTKEKQNPVYKFVSFEFIKQSNFKYLLTCNDENSQSIRILLNEKFQYLKNIPVIQTALLISGIEIVDSEKRLYKQTNNTLIVVEPGYLIDITDVAECFSNNSYKPILFFKRIILNNTTSQNLAKGNLVNHIFDSLINDPAIDFETAFKVAIKYRPVSLMAALLSEANWDFNNVKKLKETAIELKNNVFDNYRNLQRILPSLEIGNYIIEPSFISESYGLQGRLDLLINKDYGEKNVIELKAGKYPNGNLKVSYLNSDSFLNVWVNHYAQANGYNLLLDDVFENRRGTSAILYSSDREKPLRNVSNIQNIKELILHVRNQIIILIKQIITNQIDLEWIVQQISNISFNYVQKDNDNDVLDNIEIGEWHYLNDCFRFIITEEYLHKLRNNLVRMDLLQNDYRLNIQNDSYLFWNNLEIDYEASDFTVNHIVIKIEDNTYNFREGDQIVLYPDIYIEQPTKFYILKGTVREVTNDSVTISLLSKSTDKSLFLKYPKWTIEIENTDDLIKKQLQVLNKFIYSPKYNRKKVIYGKQNNYEHTKIKKYKYLNKKQQNIVQRAINNQDYFLIQGPPGTGKTSRILRALVDYYYSNTDCKILLMSFTNRSVEEICQTLDRIEPNFPFLRISSKNIENFVDRSVPFLSEKLSINLLLKKFSQTRVFVGTVSAFTSNLEIFQFLKFDLMILDEASQVVETQVNGFLASVPKFILIGDINQLPAITLQENLLGNNSNSYSILGRLLQKANENNKIPPIGHLRHQGRMHQKIQDFANHLTYQQNLFPIHKKQLDKTKPSYLTLFDHPWLSDRIVFVESLADSDPKSNRYEAELISKFLEDYFRYNGNNIPAHRIGIVAPFKKHCALIRNMLPNEIANKVTIDTVERFQGSERDIIIYSFSINHKVMLDKISNIYQSDNKIIDRKFNVATTRAKDHLIIIGNSSILETNSYYKNALDWIRENATIIKRRGRKPTLKV